MSDSDRNRNDRCVQRNVERKMILRILNDCTPLPTVLQEMIVQYLLPSGYTIVYDQMIAIDDDDGYCKGLRCLFVPYDTHASPAVSTQLDNNGLVFEDEIWGIVPYKQGVIVHSEDDEHVVHIRYIQWNPSGGKTTLPHEPTLLLKTSSDSMKVHWMTVFRDKLIIQTINTFNAMMKEMSYCVIDLQKLNATVICNVDCSVRWDQVKLSDRGSFVSMDDKYLLYLTTDRIYQFDDVESAISNRPSKVIELPMMTMTTLKPCILGNRFVVNDDICLKPRNDNSIVCVSILTGQWTKLPPYPQEYQLIWCSIDGHLVVSNGVNALTYCSTSQSWIEFDFPASTIGLPEHVVCMGGCAPLAPRLI